MSDYNKTEALMEDMKKLVKKHNVTFVMSAQQPTKLPLRHVIRDSGKEFDDNEPKVILIDHINIIGK